MSEQKTVFVKVDEIKSGVDELNPQKKWQTEEEAEEFIRSAERVFIYAGQKSEYKYQTAAYNRRVILLLILLAVNVLTPLIPACIFEGTWWFWVAFAVVAAANIPYGIFLCVQLFYEKRRGYTIPYSRFKVWWNTYFYDDNGIICDCKLKIPFHILRGSFPFFNIAAGSLVLFVYMNYVGIAVFAVLSIVSIISIFLLWKGGGGYILYFIKEDEKIQYADLFQFMQEHDLK